MSMIFILFIFYFVFLNCSANETKNNTKNGTDVNFYLYYKNNGNAIKIDSSDVGAFETSGTKRVTFVTHGFLSNGNSDTPKKLKDCISKNAEDSESATVVDWGKYSGSSFLDYSEVVDRVPQIGLELGKLLVKLYNEKKVDPNNIHLIGHSLGAHVSSFAAQYFLSQTNKRIGHLTGLDPARPEFKDKGITRTDAIRVDILHTSILGIEDIERGHYVSCIGTKDNCSSINVFCQHSYAADFYCNSINKSGCLSDPSKDLYRMKTKTIEGIRIHSTILNGYYNTYYDIIRSPVKPEKCKKCTPTKGSSEKYCEEDKQDPEPPHCVPNRSSRLYYTSFSINSKNHFKSSSNK